VAARAELSKLPDHIAFLLLVDSQDEQELPWEQLASLVLWSITLGVHSISLYDLRGQLKLNQEPFDQRQFPSIDLFRQLVKSICLDFTLQIFNSNLQCIHFLSSGKVLYGSQ
jgi:hypothetical protein